MIHKPGASDLYGFLETKDQMPAFASDQLTENDVTTLIRFLKNDYLGAPRPQESRARPRSSGPPARDRALDRRRWAGWASSSGDAWSVPRHVSSALGSPPPPPPRARTFVIPHPPAPRRNRAVWFSKKWTEAIPRRPGYGAHDHSYD